MNQMHISQLDIQQAVAVRIGEISLEIQQLEQDGVKPGITAQDLFNLEALGLVYDFATQIVSCESAAELPQGVRAVELSV